MDGQKKMRYVKMSQINGQIDGPYAQGIFSTDIGTLTDRSTSRFQVVFINSFK
ncbi:MAG: hypothetical protein HN705_04200 [Rhodospirillales bacterium]|nr:hypothetical protein [Rhodospirillales bacterium]